MSCKIISVLFLFLSIGSFISQESHPMVLTAYTQNEVQVLKIQDPNQFEILNLYAEQGIVYFLETNSSGKWTEIDKVISFDRTNQISNSEFVSEIQKESFNPLLVSWRPKKSRQYYHLSGTQLYFIIPSETDLKRAK
jgi:hypothetical protein